MIQEGSIVRFHYSLTVDGDVVDSSRGREPLEYAYGSGTIIPGLEAQLGEMTAGDKKNVTVAPEQGYGPRNPDGLQKVPKTLFADASDLKAGGVVSGTIRGEAFEAMVQSVGIEDVTIDLNHPLAGKTLNFEIELVSVTPA